MEPILVTLSCIISIVLSLCLLVLSLFCFRFVILAFIFFNN